MTILEALWRGRERRGDDPMLTFVDIQNGEICEETRSYADLWRNGSAVCAALKQAGMKAEDSFALIMHNHPEFVDCMAGSAMAGTVFVPIDPRVGDEKLRFMLDFSDCRGVVVADYALSGLAQVVADLPKLEWIWVVGEATPRAMANRDVLSFQAILDADCEEPGLRAIDPAEPMQLLFTSGTTGDPKAIRSPHARFMFATSLGHMTGLTLDDRLYTGLPLSHANAQFMTLGNALTMQLPCVISRRFTKSRLWEILARYECTTFNLLGGMTTAIFAEPPGAFDRAHKVRFVLSAGMPVSMWTEFADRFGIEIFEFYGTAEGGLLLNPPGGPIGSVGRPPAGSVCELLDEDGVPVPDGELGEFCFRNADGTVAPVLYYKNGDASSKKTAGGWFHSGDMGWRDADGWYYFAHRIGTAIRRNGEFITPSDIEKVIAEDPGVIDVYVYGVATTANTPGEREVVAVIVPDRQCFDAHALFVRSQSLPANSRPAFLQLVAEIPKTASEKPQDRFLLEMLSDGSSTVIAADESKKLSLGE